MIANKTTGSSFKGLINYLSNPEKMEWLEQRNCFLNNPDAIALEMEQTASHSKAKKPVYHISLSWSEFDAPVKDQMIEIADDFLKHMNLEDHQVAMFAHSDRTHPHLHLVINRIHPQTEKAWEPYLYHGAGRDRRVRQTDFSRMEEFLRAAERQYGWEIIPGKHFGQHHKEFDGRAPNLWEMKQDEKTKVIAEIAGIQNIDGRSVKERADELKDDLYYATSFAELDKTLAQNGLWIQAEGQGAVFTDGTHKVKSSSVSRGLSGPKLEKRFGESLKSYEQEREQLVQAAGGQQILSDWINLKARENLEETAVLTQTQIAKIDNQLKRFSAYNSEFEAVKKEIQVGFGQAFGNSREAYRKFGKYAQKVGFAEAQAELVANPQRFGKIKDIGSIVQASKAIRELEKLQGRYSTHITGFGKQKRKEKIASLHGKTGQLKQESNTLNKQLLKGETVRALKDKLYNHFREDLTETEAGQSIDSSVINTISLARALQEIVNDPEKAPLSVLKQVGRQSGKNMTSEAGRAANQMASEGLKYFKNVGELLANPSMGTIKLAKNIIQSSVRYISQPGKGLSR